MHAPGIPYHQSWKSQLYADFDIEAPARRRRRRPETEIRERRGCKQRVGGCE